MVILTITPSIVEALAKVEPSETLHNEGRDSEDHDSDNETQESPQPADEPSLEDPQVGKPISHGQIVDLWKRSKAQDNTEYTLEQLLRGASVYIPPPPPKPEPSPEYKALMARLRRQEEARSYERMMNPIPQQETFKDRFPSSAAAFAEANRPTSASDIGDEDIAMEEVHKQVTLIINFLVSIAGVAGTLWVTARWWSLPSRLFLTMGGSILVAIAEVVVYNAYIWKMDEGKKKHGKVKEVREVVESWTVGKLDDEDEKTILLKERDTTGLKMSETPAPVTSRPRTKPLRTYGKRSTRDDSPRETSLKRRRPSPETTASKDTEKEAQSLPKIVSEETKNAAECTTATSKSVKKGSILSFFKPIPSSSTAASSPKSDEPEAGSSPPSSPPPPRIETRKKPRLLRFRGASLPSLDGENTEDDNQAEEGIEAKEEGGSKPKRPALRENSSNRESSSSSDMKAGKKGKSKASTVQTTLNLSSQAAFSECKVCNTVWNPLYPDDVKFHTKQHAAVLRARRKEKENEL
ncbi:vacuolar er assembly vma12 [Fusarium longipes]|uniref:Vacuolar er assembly vma12 n=1 Tax=Fusarium longipes TaxID=694270 RepID=A0A395S110_9HYPO|nr:vacuolar er assembly vma12 [Fusarium longipes]